MTRVWPLLLALMVPLTLAHARPDPVTAPPMRYVERTLPNGLRIVSLPDRGTGLVAVQVWYAVGSRHDPAGRSGFAHLFEHMMFKATRNMPNEMIDRLSEDVGGYANARTTDDYTSYVDVVPANQLRRILWAEAERMGSLVVDQATLDSERLVVKEELRERVLAPPYGPLAAFYVVQTAFTRHPYGRPGVGSMADLDAATLDDLRAFHAAYYRPDNAVLVVAGNFDQGQLDRWIDEYFAPLARPRFPIPRVDVREPNWTQARRHTAYRANVSLPAIALSFRTPAITSPDMPAYMLIEALLAEGDGSRLPQALQHEQQLVTGVGARLYPRRDEGILTTIAILADGVAVERAEAALRDQFALLRNRRVQPAELRRAKAMVAAKTLRARETSEGRAGELASAAIFHGSPAAAESIPRRIAAVTADDIQRVARRYLRDEASVSVRLIDETQRPAGPAEASIETSTSLVLTPLPAEARNATAVTLAAPADRVAPPPPAAPLSVGRPKVSERRLANRLRLVVIERHDTPMVAMRFITEGGSASDPPGQAGAAQLLARLLTRGAGARSGESIAADVEATGGAISADAGWDTIDVTLRTTRPALADTAAIFADVVRRPTLSSAELDSQRTQLLDQRAISRRNVSWVAASVAAREGWTTSSYRTMQEGTPATLRAINRDALIARHREWRPDASALIVAGAVTVEEAWRMANTMFGEWRPGDVPVQPVRSSPSEPVGRAAGTRVIAVNMPDARQPAVVVLANGARRTDPNYPAAFVATAVLGGGYSSRLSQDVRVRRGLTYGITSALDTRATEAHTRISTLTRDEAVPEVVDRILAGLQEMIERPSGPDELQARKEATIGRRARRLETADGLADLVAGTVSTGGSARDAIDLDDRLRMVSSADVSGISSTMLAADQATVVVAGDTARFLPDLLRKYPQTSVISIDALDR